MHVDEHRARVVFFAHFKVVEFAVLAQVFCSNARHIHESDRFVFTAGIQVGAHCLIFSNRLFKQLCIRTVLHFYIFQNSIERCVAAVVAPIRVEYANFSKGRITFNRLEIILHELHISKIHCKTKLITVRLKFFCIQLYKAFNSRNVSRNRNIHLERFRFFIIGKATVYRID